MENDNQSFDPNTQPTPNVTPAPEPQPTPAPEPQPTLTPEPQPVQVTQILEQPIEPSSSPSPELPSSPSSQLTPQAQPVLPDSDPMPDIPIRPVKQPMNKSLITLIIVAAALVICAIVAIIIISNINTGSSNNTSNNSSSSQTTEDFTESYNLADQTSNLEITKTGRYELTGELKEHSVIVNADGPVTLYLNDATINATQMAAIANISPNSLTIELADGTTNRLTDGGASDYDACLYSTGALTIDGTSGALYVEGRQNEGEGIAADSNDLTINGGSIAVYSVDDGLNAGGDGGTITINGGDILIQANGDGIDSNKDLIINDGSVYVSGSSEGGNAAIDTDEGYTINGGIVIAFGSDMLEKPSDSSKQNTLVVALEKSYNAKAKVALEGSDGQALIEATAPNSFKTLIISSKNLSYGTYKLVIDGETVIDPINVINTITTHGNVDQRPTENQGEENKPNEAPVSNNDQANSQTNNDQVLTNGTDTYGRIPLSEIPVDEN